MSSRNRKQLCPCQQINNNNIHKIFDCNDTIDIKVYLKTFKMDHESKKRRLKSTVNATDTFILQNTKDTDVLTDNILPAFDYFKTECPRCKHILNKSQKLSKTSIIINKNEIIGICDRCRKKLSGDPCKKFSQSVNQFDANKNNNKDSRHDLKTSLTNINRLLTEVISGEKRMLKRRCRAYSDFNLSTLRHNSAITVTKRDPEIKNLFHTEKSRTGSNLTLIKSTCSPPEYSKKTKAARFFDPSYLTPDAENFFYSRSFEDFSHGKDYWSDLDDETTRNDNIKKRVSVQHLKNRVKNSKVQTAKQLDDFKYMESRMDYGIKEEKPKASIFLSRKSMTNLYRKESPRVTPIKKYNSEEALYGSISGIIDDTSKMYFRYYFPKETNDVKRKPTKPISSSELIKCTQDRLKAEAEKEILKFEEERRKKQEEKEKKIIAYKERKKLDEEQKLIVDKELKIQSEEKEKSEKGIKEPLNDLKVLQNTNEEELEEKGKRSKLKSETNIFIKKQKVDNEQEKQKDFEDLKKKSDAPVNYTKPDKSMKNTESKDLKDSVDHKKSIQEKSKNLTKEKDDRVSKKDIGNLKANNTDGINKEIANEKVAQEANIKSSHKDTTDQATENLNSSKSYKQTKNETEAHNKEDSTKKEQDNQDKKNKESNEVNLKLSKEKDRKENIEIFKTDKKNQIEKPDQELKVSKPSEESDKVETKAIAKNGDKEANFKERKEKEEKKAQEAVDKKNISVPEQNSKKLLNNKTENKSTSLLENKHAKKQDIPTTKDLNLTNIKVRNASTDDLTLKMVNIKQEPLRKEINNNLFDVRNKGILINQKKPKKSNNADSMVRSDSDVQLELERLSKKQKANSVSNIIIGEKIFKYKPSLTEKCTEKQLVPILFTSLYKEDFMNGSPKVDVVMPVIPEVIPHSSNTKEVKSTEQEVPKGVIRYALSDRTFIDKGWTLLPTEKVVRKMNVYRMRPAHPEFDWFEHNKTKRLMEYDTGEKLAEFNDNGRGRWFYKNGRVALDYYDAEETNAQQRFVVYSSGEPDERGRSRPFTILATFDYLGNGIVFDHIGKIRLKYNQTEGVVLDRSIGPVSHWKWHTLNDPPVLQQVMIDTQMSYKDPDILKLGGPGDIKNRPDNEEMLAIEFDNFIKEKSRKLTQTFKPFQIKMKALKINEQFSLKVLDQATVYLIFRDGSANLKLNLGMILDHKEIIDTETAELGEVSNSLERLPARSDSIAELQNGLTYAQHIEKLKVNRDRRLRPTAPCASADRLAAATSRPLRLPFRTAPSTSTTTISCACKCRKPSSDNLYYDSRLL